MWPCCNVQATVPSFDVIVGTHRHPIHAPWSWWPLLTLNPRASDVLKQWLQVGVVTAASYVLKCLSNVADTRCHVSYVSYTHYQVIFIEVSGNSLHANAQNTQKKQLSQSQRSVLKAIPVHRHISSKTVEICKPSSCTLHQTDCAQWKLHPRTRGDRKTERIACHNPRSKSATDRFTRGATGRQSNTPDLQHMTAAIGLHRDDGAIAVNDKWQKKQNWFAVLLLVLSV